jgi:hypothetical protein
MEIGFGQEADLREAKCAHFLGLTRSRRQMDAKATAAALQDGCEIVKFTVGHALPTQLFAGSGTQNIVFRPAESKFSMTANT